MSSVFTHLLWAYTSGVEITTDTEVARSMHDAFPGKAEVKDATRYLSCVGTPIIRPGSVADLQGKMKGSVVRMFM